MQFIGWVVFYILAAWLFGFWPFEEGYLTGPTSECSYEAGYEDGYDGAIQKCSTSAYLTGYDEGDFEADCHWLRCVRPDRHEFERRGCGSWDRMSCR